MKPAGYTLYIQALLIVFFTLITPSLLAKDKIATCATQLAGREMEQLNQATVRKLAGTPSNIEAKTRKSTWIYYNDQSKMEIEWEGLPGNIKKIKFEILKGPRPPKIDYSLADKLKSDETNLAQAIKIFGIPGDMEIKENTQELHYSFADKNMRLFFRDRILADFTLY